MGKSAAIPSQKICENLRQSADKNLPVHLISGALPVGAGTVQMVGLQGGLVILYELGGSGMLRGLLSGGELDFQLIEGGLVAGELLVEAGDLRVGLRQVGGLLFVVVVKRRANHDDCEEEEEFHRREPNARMALGPMDFHPPAYVLARRKKLQTPPSPRSGAAGGAVCWTLSWPSMDCRPM